jgi:hypothetical protein
VVSEGTIDAAAVESMEKESAVVLVTATRDGDQIKMSKLVYVP